MVEFIGKIIGGNEDRISIVNFNEPMAITIELIGRNLISGDIAKLTGIRYIRDIDGNMIPVKIGGKYNETQKIFTFHADKTGLYGVSSSKNITIVKLMINDFKTTVNGVE